jgi:RNA polymerase sigma factor for flagellar operon FliA
MSSPTLWQAFADGDPEARERLMSEHLGLVLHFARQLSRTLAAAVDFGELVSAGVVGLITALDHFDHSRGLAFSTFAAPRIRGAILDDLRRQDHLPRSLRRRARELAHAREALAHSLGRAPDDREIAAHLGVPVGTVWRWRWDAERAQPVPLDHSRPGRHARIPAPAEVLACDDGDAADERLNRSQEAALLRDALLRLTAQERTVLSLYYFEELKLHEIATVLAVTESRVSQIRSKALAKLRRDLRRLRECVA